MKFAYKGLLLTIALFLNLVTLQLFAQDNSLRSQFEDLKDKSNNYQVYKVVKKTDLESFWNSIADTLRTNASNTNALKVEVAQLKSEVNTLQNQVAQRDSSLANQEYMIEHMDFVGISVAKGTYQTITWIIIFGLLIVVIVLYLRFTGAHKVTKSTKLEFANLQEEFESHRQKARETETKLKRDLQTEINKVEEMKEKFGS